jgi:hypothetical protein
VGAPLERLAATRSTGDLPGGPLGPLAAGPDEFSRPVAAAVGPPPEDGAGPGAALDPIGGLAPPLLVALALLVLAVLALVGSGLARRRRQDRPAGRRTSQLPPDPA